MSGTILLVIIIGVKYFCFTVHFYFCCAILFIRKNQMKKNLLSIIVLTLFLSSCTNSAGSLSEQSYSLESSNLSDQSTVVKQNEWSFSWVLKHYLGDTFILDEFGYYWRTAESTPQKTYSDNNPLIAEQLNKIVFHVMEEGESVFSGDAFVLHIIGHDEINNYSHRLNCGSSGTSFTISYGEKKDMRVDLVSFTSEEYYTETKALFESLFSY